MWQFWLKITKSWKKHFWQQQNRKTSSSKLFFLKTLNPQITHWCEAPRSMLSNYFGKRQVLRGTFGEIWSIQIQIYPQTSFEPRYGAFYWTNGVSAHGLGLLVQLSWRVAPPYVTHSSFLKISVWCCNAKTVGDGAFRHKIDWFNLFRRF